MATTPRIAVNDLTLSGATRTGPVVSTITYLTRSGTSAGVAFNTVTLRPAHNSFTIFPTWSISTSPPSATSLPVPSQPNGRAIAGGVIGACALLIATVTALVFFRRGRPSRHWNAYSKGKWYDLEGKHDKDAGPSHPSTQKSCDKGKDSVPDLTDHLIVRGFQSEDRTPPYGSTFKPLFVRDKHRPTPSDPFADPQTSLVQMGHKFTNRSHSAMDSVFEMELPRREKNTGLL